MNECTTLPRSTQEELPYGRLKPIPTSYNGHRFRSRLEARWAVFFDALGVPWEYEQDGFELPNGDRYLPDFWFPRWQMFGEVKPTVGKLQEQLEKYELLAQIAGHPVLGIVGPPALGKNTLFVFQTEARPDDCGNREHVFAYDRRDSDVLWAITTDQCCACVLDKPKSDHERYPLYDDPRLTDAYESASSAQFERECQR